MLYIMAFNYIAVVYIYIYIYTVTYLTAQNMDNLKLELFNGNECVILELYELLRVLNFVIFLRL